jgi:hypothetical protein
MVRFNPSSSAFIKNGEVISKQAFGCLRMSLALQHRVRPGPIPPILATMGDQHELDIQALLEKDGRDFNREEWLPEVMEDFPNIKFRGRVDYHMPTEKTVIECKGLASKPKRGSIIRKGQVPVNHVAQVLSYMYQYKYNTGWLVYSYYQYAGPEGDRIICPPADRFGENRRWFKVTLDDAGLIYIDGEKFEYDFMDFMRYLAEHERVMTTGSIPNRPYVDDGNPYASPCTFCAYSQACDKVDTKIIMGGETPEADYFLDECRQLVKTEPGNYDLWRPKKPVKED